MDIDSLTIGEVKKLKALIGGCSDGPAKCIVDGGVKIVVLQRGWVAVGRYSQNGSDCKLSDAAIIRKWGTTKGLPELVSGPTKDTILDKTDKPISFHELTVVLTLDAEEAGWKKHL
jgi:hypothetical protein